ncbi:PAS domain-containing sensor histidine kinase [Hyalangium sp.]|uniref:PAS domain-containing sensor histidine kinase n=1 Tax=Hyalangium sp. TaxID=2028555 RepID=UPI002D4C4E75|nr:PAS domain-containing sensor histidine kinase [Hyalangium sp.]HYH98870.1 PAS domain-containing sensor histidine kinase [Hyalangium sp.]
MAVPEEARPFVLALLNAPGWAVAFLDRELRLRWANDTLVGLTGEPLSFQLGRSLAELWPGLAPSLAPLCARALAGEAIQGAAVTGAPGLTKSGEKLHLRISLLPAVSGGALAGLTLLLQDETERMREEELLRESELRLKTLLDLSCDGYLLLDKGTVLEASRGSYSLLGCSPTELVGQPLARFLAPEFRKSAQDSIKEQDMPYELIAMRYGDQRVPLQALGREVTFRGKPACLVALWDITGKKAAEEAVTRAEYLREQFLGVVGHDLRTPLNTLQLGISALQLDGKLEENQMRQLTIMGRAARRMERMIHDLLDFTRARLAGGIPVTPSSMVMGFVIERVMEEYRLAHPEHPIVPSTEGDLAGHWDEARLAQLLDNLLQNALRHSLKDIPIRLSVKGEASGVTLTVLNKGPLLPPEEREAIFEPFRRGKRPAGEGLGLGLYIAKQIAEAHGGRISVESSAEHGTSFKVWLPRWASSAR